MSADGRPSTRLSPGRIAALAGLAGLALATLPFVDHAARFGIAGLTGDLARPSYLAATGAPFSNVAIFAHMLVGAVVTLLAPLQLVPFVRSRYPAIHRACGYVVAFGALFAAAAGLTFIALRGTIGGPAMDAGFAGYGLALGVAAAQTLRFARARDRARHRDWALRLVVLAMGSWLYRLHYTLWYLLTGGLGSAPDFSGPFDRIQNVAFYVPYLIALEVWRRRRDRRAGLAGGSAHAG